MTSSEFVKSVNEIQASIRVLMKENAYKVRGRTFNRVTEDGLTQVVNFQMGSSDPPGTTYIPGLRENLYGLFTVNLGVHIPEVAVQQNCLPKNWVQEHQCCIRDRLGPAGGSPNDIWWQARAIPQVVDDVTMLLTSFGLPFLNRFSSRDLILSELKGVGGRAGFCATPRIVSAIILVGRNENEKARALLQEQVLETRNPGHPAYVRSLAERLGLGTI